MLLNTKFKISRKLLLELDNCDPNRDMDRMYSLNFITLLSIRKHFEGYYRISFKEITGGNAAWSYTEDFVEELKNCKVNDLHNNELNIE